MKKLAFILALLIPTTASASLLLNGSSQYSTHGNILDQTTGSFTVAAWVYPKAGTPIQCAVSKRNSSGTGYALCYGNNANKFEYINHDGTTQDIAESASTYTVKNWYCAVGVTDKTAGTIYIYVNGSQVGTQSTVNSLTNSQAFLIGNSGDSFFWNGQIANVQVFNRVLSTREIKAFCSGSTFPVGGLIGYFPLLNGGPVVDWSSGRHLGALVAGPIAGFSNPPLTKYYR